MTMEEIKTKKCESITETSGGPAKEGDGAKYREERMEQIPERNKE